MSGVFQNTKILTPHPPHRPASVYAPAFLGGEGVGVNILEGLRYCSVFYICKYFVCDSQSASCSDDISIIFIAV
jgi:hypothetical protein